MECELFLLLLCLCMLWLMCASQPAGIPLELYFYSGSVTELLFNQIINHQDNQMDVLRKGQKVNNDY